MVLLGSTDRNRDFSVAWPNDNWASDGVFISSDVPGKSLGADGADFVVGQRTVDTGSCVDRRAVRGQGLEAELNLS